MAVNVNVTPEECTWFFKGSLLDYSKHREFRCPECGVLLKANDRANSTPIEIINKHHSREG